MKTVDKKLDIYQRKTVDIHHMKVYKNETTLVDDVRTSSRNTKPKYQLCHKWIDEARKYRFKLENSLFRPLKKPLN